MIESVARYLGVATSLQAEYEALICGLEAALRHKAQSITILTGSEALCRQLQGKSSSHAPEAVALYARAHELAVDNSVDVEWTDPERLETAERLANLAVDSRGRRSH